MFYNVIKCCTLISLNQNGNLLLLEHINPTSSVKEHDVELDVLKLQYCSSESIEEQETNET